MEYGDSEGAATTDEGGFGQWTIPHKIEHRLNVVTGSRLQMILLPYNSVMKQDE
jgi:hypothetical protein